MERLTRRLPNGVIRRTEVTGDSVMRRCAAYEDTGLAPEDIKQVQEASDATPFGRFREIMEAERDGRLVILDEPMRPVISIDEGARLLCPSCRNDLMGGWDECDDMDKIMYQCPCCGQSIDTTKALAED